MRFGRRTYKHRCPDGSVKVLYKNVDDAFPLSLSGMGATLSADVGALVGAPGATVAGEYQNKLQGLLFSLSERNESLMLSFRGIYLGYQSDPCANQASFDRQLEGIIAGVQRLTELQIKVRGVALLAQSDAADHAELARVFHDLVVEVGGPVAVDATVAEIEAAREDASQWIGPGAETQ